MSGATETTEMNEMSETTEMGKMTKYEIWADLHLAPLDWGEQV